MFYVFYRLEEKEGKHENEAEKEEYKKMLEKYMLLIEFLRRQIVLTSLKCQRFRSFEICPNVVNGMICFRMFEQCNQWEVSLW